MNERDFHLGDILTITTGRLVSPRHIEGVYDILNYMTAGELYTHQLPRAAKECKPHLLEQMPWLREINYGDVNGLNWEQWLGDMVSDYGEHHPVSPVADYDGHTNPMKELVQMAEDAGKDVSVTAVFTSTRVTSTRETQ